MDSQTHVVFARHLLRMVSGPSSLAVASLFPQIDRSPPTLHRLYAHTVVKAKGLAELGLRCFTNNNPSEVPFGPFPIGRFRVEKERMFSYLTDPEKTAFSSPGFPPPETPAGVLGLLSHIYLDSYNQPTQSFLPLSVGCAGQWALWEDLGDFREALYLTSRIEDLRQEFDENTLWKTNKQWDVPSLCRAMLRRLVDASQGKISLSAMEKGWDTLNMPSPEPAKELEAVQFLTEFENILSTLHRRFLKQTVTRAMKSPPVEVLTNRRE
jgi:hypothetical protein